MRFEEFKAWLDEERPPTLTAGQVAQVHPRPWVLRAGHGNEARIRMIIEGEHRYERAHGESTWVRVEGRQAEFDVLDDAA